MDQQVTDNLIRVDFKRKKVDQNQLTALEALLKEIDFLTRENQLLKRRVKQLEDYIAGTL